jgi:hypothetical protein
MTVQALADMSAQWHRFFMDIPYELILALAIYFWGPAARGDAPAEALR